LALLGYLLYRVVPDDSLLFSQLEHYSHYLKITGFILLGAAIIFIIYKVRKNKKKKEETSEVSDKTSATK
jgi:membrane protein DedA with SNARE-associated domain